MREDLNEPDTNKGDSDEDDEDDSPDNSVTQVSGPIRRARRSAN